MTGRRLILFGGASLVLAGCERPCYENNPEQKRFLDALAALAKPALASGNPLAVEAAAQQSVALANKISVFSDWCGTLKTIEGNAKSVAITVEIGNQISLYAFNDWTLGVAGSVVGTLTDLFSTRSRETPPPGLSEGAVAALKALRLGERVKLGGKMGEIAGSGLFDLSRLIGKGEAENRQFLQTPRFVARIETLSVAKKT